MVKRLLMIAILTLSTLVVSGCLTVGPRVKTEFIILKAGLPGRVLENTEVKIQRLDGEGLGEVDIGGWVVMPPDDYEYLIKRASE